MLQRRLENAAVRAPELVGTFLYFALHAQMLVHRELTRFWRTAGDCLVKGTKARKLQLDPMAGGGFNWRFHGRSLNTD